MNSNRTSTSSDAHDAIHHKRVQREAAPGAATHTGPTAERYGRAIERYVQALSSREPLPHPSEKPRLSFPPLTVGHVMTRGVVSAHEEAEFKEIARSLHRNRINSVPVVDDQHRVIGVVTMSDLLARVGYSAPAPRGHRLGAHARRRQKLHALTARELMTAPAITTHTSTSIADAARDLARLRVHSMPVVDRDGGLVGMVSRGDLIRLFLREDEEILRDVLRKVVPRSAVPAPDVQVSVTGGIVTLSGHLDSALRARGLVHAAGRVPGVLDVRDELTFDVNDLYFPRAHA